MMVLLVIGWADDKHPTQSRMEDYASALGLTYEQVRRWFIERRRRDKQNVDRSRGRGTKSAGSRAKKKCKTKNNKNVSNLAPGEDGNTRRGPLLAKDMLYSPDYILKKVFRKDGPPLGVEFDCLPSTAFQGNSGSSGSLSGIYFVIWTWYLCFHGHMGKIVLCIWVFA